MTVAVIGLVCFVLSLFGALGSLLRRWYRSAESERRLLVWAATCTALIMPALLFEMFGTLWGAWVVVAAAFPVAAVVAIIRYGLYDIDLLIHRTLLYGLLVTTLAAAYTVAVLAALAPFPDQAHLIGTVAVVLALAPVHRWLRNRLDRWLYGGRADPYEALAQLGERLAHPLQPDEVLFTVARSIAEALKLPYVAVRVDAEERAAPHAQYGTTHGWPQSRFPMTHRGAPIGRLVAEARGPEAGLAALDALPAAMVATYQPYWALRAHLLAALGRPDEAGSAYARAIALCQDETVRKFLVAKEAQVKR